MSLAQRISDLAAAVRGKINLMVPRLMPAGGSTGHALVKTSNADYAASWQAQGTFPWTDIKLTSDAAVSTVAFAAVAGMSFSASANTWYEVECFGAFRVPANTTGMALALDVPSGTVQGLTIHPSSATAVQGVHQIADATTTGVTTGAPTANTDCIVRAMFMVQVGATPGSIALMLRSEVAGSAVTLQANKFKLRWRQLP